MSASEFAAVAPFAILVAGALVCLALEAAGAPVGARKRGRRTHLALIAASTAGAASVQVGITWPSLSEATVFRLLASDRIGHAAAQTVLAILVVALAAAIPALRQFGASGGTRTDDPDLLSEERGDLYALLLLAAAGFLCLAMAQDLILVAVGTTLVSVCASALLVVDRRDSRGAEAAVKQLEFTAVQLALLALGIALLWGTRGEIALSSVPDALMSTGWERIGGLVSATAILMLLPAVPLHTARVDVVQGAPSFVAAFLAPASLVAGAALVVRSLGASPFADAAMASSTSTASPMAFPVLALLVVGTASILLPAIAALDQRSIDRLGAHLTVTQAGVVLLPACLLAAGNAERAGLVLICAAGGAVAIIGVAACMGCLEHGSRTTLTWEEWSGLGRRHPAFALALLWFLGSLAGFPATAGFAARLGTTRAAFEDGQVWVALCTMLSPAVAAIVIIRLGIFLFAKVPSSRCVEPIIDPWRALVIGVAAAAVLGLGVAPEPLWNLLLSDVLTAR